MLQRAALIVPLRLRSATDSGRKVTWLELFFDLVFVAAVAQVASPLRDDYSLAGLLRFTPLFLLIWWAWTGHTVFSTRFDTDDVIQRGLTLVQIFAVAAMAANAREALDSRSSAGFMAAYAGVRVVLLVQYFRARRVPEAKALTRTYLLGHGVAAGVWLLSAVLPVPARYAAWIVAFAMDLGTPWIAVPHSVRVPPDEAHLPERFGLFTLILLGESVVAVMEGMESQETWTAVAATSAFLGMASLFLLWWWYFDGAGRAEQPVRNHRDAVRLHVWSYAHFPLYVGIVVTGVGLQRIVTAAARTTLEPADAILIASASALAMTAMAIIATATADPGRVPAGGRAGRTLVIAAATFLFGIVGRPAVPVVLAIAMATCWSAQLAAAMYQGSRNRPHDRTHAVSSCTAGMLFNMIGWRKSSSSIMFFFHKRSY